MQKVKQLRDKASHPLCGFWRSTMQGLVDVLTDVLFCLSLAYESVVAAARLRAADEEAAAARLEAALSPLFFASAACIAVSVLFNFTATLWLYFSRGREGDHLARTVFSVDASSHHKLFFFLVILLATLVNIRLAALLPWKKEARRTVLVRIQKLYLAGKCIEDLPQLTICLLYTSPSPRDQRGSRMPSSA